VTRRSAIGILMSIELLFNGVNVTAMGPDGRARLGLGRSFQDSRLFPALTVAETVAVALERHVQAPQPLAAAVVSPAVRLSELAVSARVDELLDSLSLTQYRDLFIAELSTGVRRLVDLACVLAHEPDVLLLDEPSSGIAQRETEQLGLTLLDIRERTGAALLVIEHDMPMITGISDEIIALELGRVITQDQPDAVLRHPRVVASYLGTASMEAITGPKTRQRPRRPKAKVAGASSKRAAS
ncbi:ATP-binding cassette domain-containing protein, partial [Phenylobacterium sp.]|uniref:ATP-binding cassette domain-containing protein n=1 Tax=Phenylobacterium sp. TaxID=1871053 RepID=UPI002730D0FA